MPASLFAEQPAATEPRRESCRGFSAGVRGGRRVSKSILEVLADIRGLGERNYRGNQGIQESLVAQLRRRMSTHVDQTGLERVAEFAAVRVRSSFGQGLRHSEGKCAEQ